LGNFEAHRFIRGLEAAFLSLKAFKEMRERERERWRVGHVSENERRRERERERERRRWYPSDHSCPISSLFSTGWLGECYMLHFFA